MWNVISPIPVLFSTRGAAVSSRSCSLQRLPQRHFYSRGRGVKLSFYSLLPPVYFLFICSVFPLTKDHYSSAEPDVAVRNFERFLCGEHLAPKKTKRYFSDGCRRMSGFNPPVRAAYFSSSYRHAGGGCFLDPMAQLWPQHCQNQL